MYRNPLSYDRFTADDICRATSGSSLAGFWWADDLPILTFTAPKAGRYIVRLKSAEAAVWGLHGALALNVVHFPAGQTKGKSIAFHRTQRGALEPPNIDVELHLNEGDDVAFELDTNAIGGGGGAVLRETEITIGWFGE
jgi:hypothetical protein